MFFSGWSVCFGASQAPNHADQELHQRGNVGACTGLALFPLETKVQGAE